MSTNPAASPAGGPALTEEYARNDVWATARVGTIAEFHAALDAYRAAVAAHHRAEGEHWKARADELGVLLGEAAREIPCAGSVAHRIRVLKQEWSETIRSLEARAERAEAEIAELKSDHMEAEDEAARHLAALQRAEAALREIAKGRCAKNAVFHSDCPTENELPERWCFSCIARRALAGPPGGGPTHE